VSYASAGEHSFVVVVVVVVVVVATLEARSLLPRLLKNGVLLIAVHCRWVSPQVRSQLQATTRSAPWAETAK